MGKKQTEQSKAKKIACQISLVTQPVEPALSPSRVLEPQLDQYQPILAKHKIEKMQSAHFPFCKLLNCASDQLLLTTQENHP